MSKLPYNPQELKRELTENYISLTSDETKTILADLTLNNENEIFSSINQNVLMDEKPNIPKKLDYDALVKHVEELSTKNKIKPCFIGDGLKWYSQASIVPEVCSIRGLTTAYTPYQPERSQGTLQTLWVYASSLSLLTGMEAINASLYERSTCLFEAFNTALRLKRRSDTVIISEGVYPGDLEVLETLRVGTPLKIMTVPLSKETGLIDKVQIEKAIANAGSNLAAICFPQVNSLGLLEDVDSLTDLASHHKISSIAIIEPSLLGNKGLKRPADYGSEGQGVTMIVGEGQDLCLGRNFGGPGLGIFGIRYNDKNKNAIRSTAGRYVGRAKDDKGNDCLCMILSTREQHIRREKATSNICSNQSFVASIAGAALLQKGDKGLNNTFEISLNNAQSFLNGIANLKGVSPGFYQSPRANEILLKVEGDVDQLINNASTSGLQLGVNVSSRVDDANNYLLLFFNDLQTNDEIDALTQFFQNNFEKNDESSPYKLEVPEQLKSSRTKELKNFSFDELKDFYHKLGELNVSPDDNIYPLGSCTMKYNPYINDYAASLTGFTEVHPQANEEDAQGCLEVIYQIQEMFKGITGLPGVTTQPVAGAQGELVGIKMFQAYHQDKGEGEQRNLILIPKSAHGTNPATATVAGFNNGIITIGATEEGEIDLEELKEILNEKGKNIAGIMITNPNTSGVFESNFKEVAELIHDHGGLVYMDGANMNAIAGIVDLDKLGVDAVHNNLHKTWTIPHGGGGPGDAIVAVSHRLVDFLPGVQIKCENGVYSTFKTPKTIGSFHRHFGNFAHKVRAYTYIRALGPEGVIQMSTKAVLSAQYLFHQLKKTYPTLPSHQETQSRLHEFIITLTDSMFEKLEKAGTPKAQAIAKVGKLFLDFGLHAPTVAFPEQYGLMIEPTESFNKDELDRFVDVLEIMYQIINETPEVLQTVPHFTPVGKVDEVMANKKPTFSEYLDKLPELPKNIENPSSLNEMELKKIWDKIIVHHKEQIN